MDDTTTTLVTAFTVEDDLDLEKQIRDRILQEAVEADAVVVTLDDPGSSSTPADTHHSDGCWGIAKKKGLLLLLSFAVLASLVMIVAIVVASGMSFDNEERENASGSDRISASDTRPDSAAGDYNKSKSNLVDDRSTIDIVRERGFVRCGTYFKAPGFGDTNAETGQLEGINIDQVRKSKLEDVFFLAYLQ